MGARGSPIKAVSKFLGVPSFYWSFIYFALMGALLYNNAADVIYRSARVFLHSVLSISFKSVEIVGLDNVPTEGPVIFTGNHANQFVDGLVVMMTSPRKVSQAALLLLSMGPPVLTGRSVDI